MNGCEKKLREEICRLETDANFIELVEKCHTLNLFEILGTTIEFFTGIYLGIFNRILINSRCNIHINLGICFCNIYR